MQRTFKSISKSSAFHQVFALTTYSEVFTW